MPKMIDADKLLEYLATEIKRYQDYEIYIERAIALEDMQARIEFGDFDCKPVQPEIEPGKTRVRHIDKRYAPYGIGIVREISKNGERAFVEWPDYNRKYFRVWGPPAPAYYRLDKLEVITDEQR